MRLWLIGGLATLLLLCVILLMVIAHFISDPSVMKKIQTAMVEQSGLEVVFESIGVDYLPSPSVALHQVSLNAPGQGQAEIKELRLGLALLPLLTGNVHLQRLVLVRPVIKVGLPKASAADDPGRGDITGTLNRMVTDALSSAVPIAPGFELDIREGMLTLERGQETLFSAGSLDITVKTSVDAPRSATASVQGGVTTLSLRRNGHTIVLGDVHLDGSIGVEDETLRCLITRLTLSEPHLEFSGEFNSLLRSPGVTLTLQGSNIDVDATRRVALALAGDVELVGEIFSYLRGGQVSQITVHTQGRTSAELGELKNLRIEGKLRDGSVSIPDIELDLTETVGNVLVADGILQATGMSTRLEGSSGHDGSLKVGLAETDDLFQLELMLNADLAQAGQILRRVVANPEFIGELNRITDLQGTGTGKLTLGDSLGNLHARVEASDLNFTASYQRIPFPIKVSRGKVLFAENLLSVKGLQGKIGDSEFAELSCQVDLASSDAAFSHGLDKVEMRLNGMLEDALVNWLNAAFEVPPSYAIRTPVYLSDASLEWQEGVKMTFRGDFSIEGGPVLSLDVEWQPNRLNIHHLKLKDQYSDSNLSLDYGTGEIALSFAGALQHESLNAIFIEKDFRKGRVEGNFSVKMATTVQVAPSASGHLHGTSLSFQLPSGDRLDIEQAALLSRGEQIEVDVSKLSWQDLTWDPVKATLDFSEAKPRIRVAEANLCGLNSPGVWTLDGENLTLDVTLEGKALNVTTVSKCVEREQFKMTGTLDLSGQISGQGRIDELITLLQGPLQANFSNGMIQQSKALSRTLEVLNVTEIVKGRLPNLSSTAFAYKTLTLQGEFRAGKILISKIEMDGETLDALGEGEIDLVQKTVDVELLAAPFQTVDTVVKNIPGVNYLMAGSLVAIPVSIKGPLDDPQVQVLSATSIGSSLLRLGERTIKSPLKLIEKFTPQRGGQNK